MITRSQLLISRRRSSGARPASTAAPLLLPSSSRSPLLAGRGRAPPNSRRSSRSSPRLRLPPVGLLLSTSAPVLSQTPARAQWPKEEGHRQPRRRLSKGASENAQRRRKAKCELDRVFFSLPPFAFSFFIDCFLCSRKRERESALACFLSRSASLRSQQQQQQQKQKRDTLPWRSLAQEERRRLRRSRRRRAPRRQTAPPSSCAWPPRPRPSR